MVSFAIWIIAFIIVCFFLVGIVYLFVGSIDTLFSFLFGERRWLYSIPILILICVAINAAYGKSVEQNRVQAEQVATKRDTAISLCKANVNSKASDYYLKAGGRNTDLGRAIASEHMNALKKCEHNYSEFLSN